MPLEKMPTNKLIEYISKFIQLNKEEIQAISSQIHIRNYKSGDILLREGDVSKVSYFSLKGCVRMYYLFDGEDKTTFFYTENCFYILNAKFYNKDSFKS
ncbi:hypothetical protein MATR_22670 [Marivirga tractuosa]|uniref:Crp/Fnr family transcriptional regulator n=1 Tax=Marivirga tractuosa TaxID=1006 RepID=UPI0002FD7307|nr:hypothetical protein [Marivirga tractuosa]BDD15442.1 hypothetical protein MATR_22670 [Marivirga tractuosa]